MGEERTSALGGSLACRAAVMADGMVFTSVTDLYAILKPHILNDSRWGEPIEAFFHQEYNPLDPGDIHDVIKEFASQHSFELHDMCAHLPRTRTVTDLAKLYSTCVKLAMAQPNKLFFMVPQLELPHSLNVVEGFFALRTSLTSGSFNVLFKNKRKATVKEKQCMRAKCFNLVLFQDDNVVTVSNNTVAEIRRHLDDLIGECPICLEPLADINCGAIAYPFKCGHAFHDACVTACQECPTCRTTHKMKGRVQFNTTRLCAEALAMYPDPE